MLIVGVGLSLWREGTLFAGFRAFFIFLGVDYTRVLKGSGLEV